MKRLVIFFTIIIITTLISGYAQAQQLEHRILFSSDRDGNREIYIMDMDGSNQTRLTNNPSRDHKPNWSPDGSKIVFNSNRDGKYEIYIMDRNGSNLKQLTDNPIGNSQFSPNTYPLFSPDGSKIAFSSDRNGNEEIYIMNIDGSNETNLTENPSIDRSPSWSPDGTKIIFSSDREGTMGIFSINIADRNVRKIINTAGFDQEPHYSPDGNHIVYCSTFDDVREIYIVNDDGSNLTQRTFSPEYFWDYIFSPRWTADGTQIVFEAIKEVQNGYVSEIAIINAFGSERNPINLSNFTYGNWDPDVSPVEILPQPPGAPELTLLSPNGGEKWVVGTTQNITWVSNNVDKVNIYYSIYNGSIWELIAEQVDAGAGFYNWPVPATPSNNCMIRITSEADTSINDVSNDVFSIRNTLLIPDYKILFSTNRDGNREIYMMDTDGSNPVNLTNNTGSDRCPDWSPDGSKIVFISDRDGNFEVYIMDKDGLNQTRLTNTPENESRYPVFSPDGSKIVFTSSRDGDEEIYIMDTDGSNQIRLTNYPESDAAPSWSPDGSKIVFVSNREGNLGIFAINIADRSIRKIINTSGDDNEPHFSPDGNFIVFCSNIEGDENWEIYVMNADGSNQIRLTFSPENSWAFSPRWTADGSQIVFETCVGSLSEYSSKISIMNADGSNPLDLTDLSTNDYDPEVSPVEIFPQPPGAPELTLLSPNGGEGWTTGTTHNITWTSSNVTNVKIEYSINGGSSWSSIITSTSASVGSYSWIIPDTPSTNCLIKISDASNAAVADHSDDIFNIIEYSPDISSGAIVYIRDKDVYISDLDCSFERNITNSPEAEFAPSISPDFKKILFSRDYDLWILDIDSLNKIKIVDNSQVQNNNIHWSDWTLDGEWIYFDAVSGCCSGGIWKVHPDGNGLTFVRNGYISVATRLRGTFGDRLVFSQRRSSLSYSQNVRITDLSGGNEENVTGGSQSEGTATFGTCWSPDGTKFAYNFGHQHIFVANYPAPYNPIEIKTFSSWKGRNLTWLDNNTLIYTDEEYYGNQMYAIDVNTKEEHYLGINGSFPYVRIASQLPGVAKLAVAAPDSALSGDSFWVDIMAQDVQDLFGASFVLNYTNGEYIEDVSTEAGDFLGDDILFYEDVDEEASKVSAGISRKVGQGEVDGSGVLMRVRFTSGSDTPYGTVVGFSLSEITANDEDGTPLSLRGVGSSITIITKSIPVWPGDTNNDDLVEQTDVLPLGLYWAETGPARPDASYQWEAQVCQSWYPDEATYADATGDGIVNQRDVLPIGLNWSKTHAAPKTVAFKAVNTSGTIKPFSLFEPPINAGDEFWVEIQVEDVSSLFGLSFVLTYNNKEVIEPLVCEQGMFLGDNVLFLPWINKDTDEVAVGITRKAGQGDVGGSGTVVMIKLKMLQNVEDGSVITFFLNDVVANDQSGAGINLTIEDGQIGTGVSDELSTLPRKFSLSQNYPNPFNPLTSIEFAVPAGKSKYVRLNIYDLRGALVRTLVDEVYNPGVHSALWDGTDETGNKVSSGVYIYRLQAGGFTKTRKMLLMR